MKLNKIIMYLLIIVLLLYLFMFGSMALIFYHYNWLTITFPAWVIPAALFVAMLKGIYITYFIMVLKNE